jgi:uncharacterized membrane protein
MNFRKFVSSLLIGVLTFQPLLAAGTEYRIPLRVHEQQHVDPSGKPGSGLGEVDAGDNPIPAMLRFYQPSLQLDLTNGFRDTRTSFLTNIGAVPARVSGLASNPDFNVSHKCPDVLPVGVSCAVSVQPTASAVGGASYTLAAMAPTAKTPALLALSTVDYTRPDKGPAPHLKIINSTVDLGKLAPGERAIGSATVTNDGTAVATLSGITSSPDFVTSTDCTATLPVGASCTIVAQFSSTVPRQHALSMDLMASDTSAPTPLTFIAWVNEDAAHMPALEFDVSTLPFSTLQVGERETKTATLSNFGSAAALLAPMKSTEDFSVAADCPAVLEVGASCVVSVTFNALTPSTRPSFVLTAKAQENVQTTISLHGAVGGDRTTPPKMVDGVSFTRYSVDFGNVPVGATAAVSVDLAYNGAIPATISSVSASRGVPNFSQTNTCGKVLDPNTQCTLRFSFTPTAATRYSDSLKLGFSDGSYTTLPLVGVGQAATLTTSSTNLSVGTIVLPGTSKPVNISLANSGNIPLTGLAVSNLDNRLAFNYGDCTSTLAPKKGCTMSFVYAPDEEGPIASGFQVTSDNGGSQPFVISGLAVRMSLAPDDLTFPETQLGTSSAVESVTLSNDGSVDIPIDGISVASGYQYFGQTNTCGKVLARGNTCTILVRYTPGRVGINSGYVTITSNEVLVAKLALSGTGVDYRLGVSATSLSFPDSYVQTASTRVVTLTNNAPDPTAITGVSVLSGASDYAQSNNCGDTLAVGASCVITIQFTPTMLGVRQGSVAITSSRGDSVVTLFGKAVERPLQLTPASLPFPDTMVGQASAVLSVEVKNPSENAATIDSLGFTYGATDFVQTSTCGKTLAGGATCTIDVTFKPIIEGARKGTLVLTGSRGKYSVGVTGKALPGVNEVGGSGSGSGSGSGPGSFQHTLITFLDTEVGKSSAVRNVTFTNRGTAPLTVQGIGVVDGESDFNQSNNCGETLAPAESCVISILFTPTAIGDRIGGIALVSDSGNFYFDLKGAGTGAAGEWSGYNDFGYVAVGKSVQRTFYLRNSGSQTLQDFDVSVVGDGLSIVTNGCRKTVTPVLPVGSSCSVVVAYSPQAWGELIDAALIATGPFVDGPARRPLKGSAPAPNLEFDSAPSPDFGSVSAGTTLTRYFVLRNKSKLPTTLAGSVQLESSDFTLVSTNCSAGRVLSASEGCSMTFSLQAGKVGDANSATYRGAVLVQSVEGASARLALAAASTPSPYTLAAVDISGGANSFGDIKAPATVAHIIKITNTAKAKQTLSFEPRLESASPEFSISKYASSGCYAGQVLAVDEYCYMYAKVTVPAGSPPGTYDLAANLVAATNEGASVELALTAQYSQEAYTLVLKDFNAVTPGTGDFGDLKAPAVVSHVIQLTNTSKSKQTLVSEPVLESASPEFAVSKYASSACYAGQVLSADEYCYMYAKVTLPAGAKPGTYVLAGTMSVSTKEGGAAELALKAQYTQEPYTLAFADLNTTSAGTGAFGNVKAPATVSHVVKLTNTSKSKQTLVSEPALSSASPEFSVSRYPSSGCYAGQVLSADEYCYMYVKLTLPAGATPGTYYLAGTMAVSTKEGGVAELALTAQYTQEAYTLAFTDLNTTSAGTGAFGNVKAPATVSHVIKLTNTSKSKQTLVSEPALSLASPELSVSRYPSSGCYAGQVLSADEYCYMYAKLTLPAGATPGTYDLAGTMAVRTKEGGAAELALTAQYTQEAYTLAFTDLNTTSAGTGSFGNIKAPATVSHVIKLTNTSKSAQTLVSEPALSSASPEFSVSRYPSSGCYAGQVLSADEYCYMYAKVTLPAGARPGTYDLAGTMVVTTKQGGKTSLALTAQYTQEAYTLAFTDLNTTSAGTGSFGNIKAPATESHVIKLTNTSKSNQTLVSEPALSSASPEFSVSRYPSSGCYAGLTLAGGEYCYMYAKVTLPAGSAPGTYNLAGTMVVTTKEGGSTELGLTAQYTQEPYTITLVDLNTTSAGTGSFGNIKAPATVSHVIKLTNTSKSRQALSFEPRLASGSPEFSVSRYPSSGCYSGMVLAGGEYCYMYAKVTLPAGSPPGTYKLAATMSAGTNEGGTFELPLSAQYTQ